MVPLVVILLFLAGFAGYLEGSASIQTVTITKTIGTSISAPRVAAASLLTSSGLNFSISINSTLLRPDQFVEITAQLFNTHATASNITSLFNDLAPRNSTAGMAAFLFLGYHLYPSPASFWDGPYLFVVLSGNFSASSLAGLGGRGLAESGISEETTRVWSYGFNPFSSSATIEALICTATCGNETVGPYSSVAQVAVRGYWTTPTPGIFYRGPPNSFSPGVYTVAVEDEWGDGLVLHFVVEGQSNSPAPQVCWIQEQVCS